MLCFGFCFFFFFGSFRSFASFWKKKMYFCCGCFRINKNSVKDPESTERILLLLLLLNNCCVAGKSNFISKWYSNQHFRLLRNMDSFFVIQRCRRDSLYYLYRQLHTHPSQSAFAALYIHSHRQSVHTKPTLFPLVFVLACLHVVKSWSIASRVYTTQYDTFSDTSFALHKL